MERALRESKEQYRDLVEKAGVAIVMDDEGGGFTYFNQRFAELFGYTVDEMRAKSIELPIHKPAGPEIAPGHAAVVDVKSGRGERILLVEHETYTHTS